MNEWVLNKIFSKKKKGEKKRFKGGNGDRQENNEMIEITIVSSLLYSLRARGMR